MDENWKKGRSEVISVEARKPRTIDERRKRALEPKK